MLTQPLKSKIDSLVKLGVVFSHLADDKPWPGFEIGLNQEEYELGLSAIASAKHKNGWFTPENVKLSLSAWSKNLTESKLNSWLSDYNLSNVSSKVVAVIMAGNIPFVGFHDLICVWLSGNKCMAKLSSKDELLMRMVIKYLSLLNPEFENDIELSSGVLKDFDAVIATGSNNSGRYFDYYFKGKPSIIRTNRTSVAVLDGNESKEQLKELGNDIFSYFGLGCRNVTKLYVPQSFDLNRFFEAIYDFKDLATNNKYSNNYDYHKAVWLLNLEDIVENGFVLLKQSTELVSPVGTLYYERFNDRETVDQILSEKKNEIQCVVSASNTPFGKAQKPELYDYADDVDTISFLTSI